MKTTHLLKPFALSLAMLTVFSVAPVFAQDTTPTDATTSPNTTSVSTPSTPSHHKHWKKHHRGCEAMKQLGLTQDQKDKLKSMHKMFREQNAATFQDMKEKYKELKALKSQSGASSDQVAALKNQLKQDRETLRQQHLAMMQSVLTPDQFQKLQTLKQQCRQSHKMRKEQ